MNNIFFTTIQREFKLTLRQPNEITIPLLFFVMVVSLFPLAINPDTIFLKQITAGIIWVAALLTTLLSFDRLFRSDFIDGTLEQILLSPHPLPVILLAKITAHWLQTGLPLLFISPLLTLMLHLPMQFTLDLFLSLLIGTPILSLLGSIMAALTVGLPNSGVLLSLLLLPFYVPILVFGAGTVSVALVGMPISANLTLLGAFFIFALITAPFATAAALRVGISV